MERPVMEWPAWLDVQIRKAGNQNRFARLLRVDSTMVAAWRRPSRAILPSPSMQIVLSEATGVSLEEIRRMVWFEDLKRDEQRWGARRREGARTGLEDDPPAATVNP